MDNLTQRIVRLREARNISKAEMSKVLELDPSNYSKYEKMGRDWTINQLESIAGALGVPVAELITGEPQAVQNDERVTELENKLRLQERLLLFFQNAENSINNQYALMFIEKAWKDERAEKIPPEVETGYHVKYNFDVETEIEKYISEKVISDDIGKALVNGGLVKKESLLEAFNRFKNVIPKWVKDYLENYQRNLMNPPNW